MGTHNFHRALTAVYVIGLVACGGGGDSANSGPSYSGNTSRAILTSTSARDSAYQALNGMAGATSPVRSASDLPATVSDIVKRLLLSKNKLARTTRAVLDNGGCGGTITDAVQTETATQYVATWSFNAFCEQYGAQTVTISGGVGVSMTADSAGNPTSMSLTYDNLTITEQPGDYVVTMAGTISFSFTSASNAFTIAMVINDSTGGSVMFQNYSVSISSSGYYSISGRFYHAIHGYVDFSTPAPMYIGVNGYPSSGGQLLIEGANGRALITATSSTTYTLQMDIDGTPGYEPSQPYSW